MGGVRDIIKKYSGIVDSFPETRQRLMLVAGKDSIALQANRIQNDGIGPDGNKMKLYSKNKFPYWKLNPSLYNSPTKIKKFQKDANKGENNGSYEALRKAYGLPINKRTLTFDGDMMASIDIFIESHDEDSTIGVIKSKDRENQDKVNWNSKRLGFNILKLSEEEKKIIQELNRERVEKLLK